MLVVSLALVAVLVAGGSGDDAGDEDAASARATAAISAPPDATATPGSVPPLPVALFERLDALPARLRDQTLHAYSTGALGQDQLEQIVTDYENRNPSVRVGSVLATESGSLRFEVFTTGEEVEVSTGDQTLVRRGDQTITLEDLRAEELVMVVTAGGSAIALTIEAFGVAAP